VFHSFRDPGADGVGVAFTSSAVNLSDAQPPVERAAALAAVADAVGAAICVVAQVHGARVQDVSGSDHPLLDLTAHQADALVSDQRGLALAVRVADCVPILFADPAAGLIGAAHAGRGGVLLGVARATVDALAAKGAGELSAWIGPHICARCYEVPAPMASDFADVTGVAPSVTRWGTPGIDLGGALRRQLDAAGVRWVADEACTMHDSGLHSYRRDGAAAGRFAGLVWLG